MKIGMRILGFGLAISLGINAYFVREAYFAKRSSAHRLPGNTVAEANRRGENSNRPLVISGADRLDWSYSNIRSVIEALRKAGAPRSVLMAVAIGLTRDQYLQRRNALLFPNGIQRFSVSHPTRAQMEEIKALVQERVQGYKDILGSDFTLETLYDDPLKMIKYGSLPEEKLEAVDRIVQDYQALSTRYRGSAAGKLDSSFASDIRQVLSDKEADDFLMYNAPSATMLQNRLAGLDVTDAQYRQIYGQEASLGGLAGVMGNPNNMVADAEILSTALKPEVFLSLVDRENVTYSSADALLAAANVPDDQRVQRYQIFLNAIQSMNLAQSSAADPTSQQTQMRNVAENAYNAIVLGLNSAARTQFDQSRAGQLLLRAMR